MKLLIVESPNKIKKISEFLGSGWKVTATVGHFRDLPAKPTTGIGVDMSTFEPQYVLDPQKKARIAEIRQAAATADKIYLATDPDREGEAISHHVVEALRLKAGSYTRVTFTEITKKAIEHAVANSRDIDMPLVRAQEARRVLDRMVGYLVTPALPMGQTAGRVQSPALRLIVDREREIRNFKPTDHFGVRAQSAAGWFADWQTKALLKPGEEYWMDRAAAERVAGTRTLICLSYKTGTRRRQPPPPFITSTLAQSAFRRLHWDSDVTARVAQKLFEQGLITYIRTDSPVISADALTELRNYLGSQGKPLSSQPRQWKAKGSAQEAHECIRPTHIEQAVAGENDEQRQLYELIRTRVLASQMAAADYETATAEFESAEVQIEGKPARFKGYGERLTSKGWLDVLGQADEESDGEDGEDAVAAPLPKMAAGDRLPVTSKLQVKTTKAPPRYDEASLVKKLESEQIGRPSTYASILSNLKKRVFIEVKKRKFHPSAVGEAIVDSLKGGGFSFIEYAFTREMEKRLDDIAECRDKSSAGEMYLKTMIAMNDQLSKELGSLPASARSAAEPVEPLEGTGDPCPKCKKGTLLTRAARADRTKRFLSCNCYPKCKFSKWPDSAPRAESNGAASSGASTSPRVQVEPLPGEGDGCPSCKSGTLRTRASRADPSKRFLSCSDYPSCKFSKWPDSPDVKPLVEDGSLCPKCAKGDLKTIQVNGGKNNGKRFLSCSNKPVCDHRVFPPYEWVK